MTVTYNARRQLLTTGTVVVYTLSVANMATSAISSLVATAISSGTLTTQLQQTYPSATANTAATVVDSTPTGSPVPPPVNAYSIPSCFAGSETVELESGDLKAIADVRSGDRVLAADGNGKAVFSEVIFVPHGANKEIALFVHITTTNGRDVKMTQNHLLPAGICGSTLPLVYASDVSVGDCVQTVSGEEKVSATESVRGEGVYTIVTKEEFIVVNGIVASPFGANHMMANLYYNIHRFVYDLAPVFLTSSLMHAVNEGLGVFVPFFAASA